jgi:hypothetical protein
MLSVHGANGVAASRSVFPLFRESSDAGHLIVDEDRARTSTVPHLYVGVPGPITLSPLLGISFPDVVEEDLANRGCLLLAERSRRHANRADMRLVSSPSECVVQVGCPNQGLDDRASVSPAHLLFLRW